MADGIPLVETLGGFRFRDYPGETPTHIARTQAEDAARERVVEAARAHAALVGEGNVLPSLMAALDALTHQDAATVHPDTTPNPN